MDGGNNKRCLKKFKTKILKKRKNRILCLFLRKKI